MLPKSALDCRIEGGKVLPTWLGEVDERFVEEVLAILRELEDRAHAEVNATARALLAGAARRNGHSFRVAEALWLIEARRWESRIDSPVPPEAMRDVVFELAAKLPHEEAILQAAQRFGIDPEQVRPSLFSDRKNRRVVLGPKDPSSAKDLILRYNLAVAQTLLLRAMDVEAIVADGAERIATVAKREGLIASFVTDGEQTRIELSGPLALLHETSKYGRGLARFVPALVASTRWSLRARVLLDAEHTGWLELDSAGAIGFAHTLPGSPDGRIARSVARALKHTHSGFRVEQDAPLVRIAGLVVVPDFALVGPQGRVLVDVVPFATDAFLARKIEAARQSPVPMLLCVDARYAPPSDQNAPEDVVLLRYHGALDPFAILTAAERALLRSSSSPWSLSSISANARSPPPSP